MTKTASSGWRAGGTRPGSAACCPSKVAAAHPCRPAPIPSSSSLTSHGACSKAIVPAPSVAGTTTSPSAAPGRARMERPPRRPRWTPSFTRRVQSPSRAQVRHLARASTLPDGAMVLHPESNAPALVWRGAQYPWGPQGYAPAEPCPDTLVQVLTPSPTLGALAAGYPAQPHSSLSQT